MAYYTKKNFFKVKEITEAEGLDAGIWWGTDNIYFMFIILIEYVT